MLGSLARRERRALWGWLTFVLFVAAGASMYTGERARSVAEHQASKDAELVAQTKLAPLLMPQDLMRPIIGERAAELTSEIDAMIVSSAAVDRVRIYSDVGRILYASDPKIVGTRPSYLEDLTFRVTNGDAETQTHVRAGLLQTYVPIWLAPDGRVAVAEMSQAHGPIATIATGPWNLIALACAALGLVTGAVALRASLQRPTSTPVKVFPPPPVRMPKEPLAPSSDAPVYEHPELRAIEGQRLAAEARAAAAEENYRSVRQQLKDTLAEARSLEERLAMEHTQATMNDQELQALRDQLRDTSERLHKAELDNNQLRERMAMRHHELEQARGQLASFRADGDEVDELKQRLGTAEGRASELSRELERMQSELDDTTGRLHLTELAEALRELEHDEIAIEVSRDEDDVHDHPVIISESDRTYPATERVG